MRWPTWVGCIEVLQWILTAGRFPADPSVVDGGVLLLETSEELPSATEVGWVLRAIGERGLLEAVDAVLLARPVASTHEYRPDVRARQQHRHAQRDTVIDVVSRYNPAAVICTGVPFGHTRPQWILPYGGHLVVDGAQRRVWAEYD